MTLIVTGVGALIHLYSVGYMAHDEDYARYFTYLNLFAFSMLVLVLADNLLLMFVGWEGVGLCSYLLIAFWYDNAQFAYNGRKAFIVNRVGDAGFLLGILTIVAALAAHGVWTLNFAGMQAPSRDARSRWRRRPDCCCSSARPANRRRFRFTYGCRTRWSVRLRSAP